MENQNIVFRLDSGAEIGYGHLMRCLTLAEQFKRRGARCYFMCRELAGANSALILQRGFELISLPADNSFVLPQDEAPSPPHSHWLRTSWQQDAAQCLDHLTVLRPILIIVDHYALDARWEIQVKPYCQKLCVIDDLADRAHQCDLLLDYNLSAHAQDYRACLPHDSQLLLGRKYVLLRDEFLQWRTTSLQRRQHGKLEHILVMFGGIDPSNHAGQVLEVLKQLTLPDVSRIDVVISSRAPALSSVLALAQTMPVNTFVHTDVSNMAQLMANADLAIGAGGGATYERLFLQLPSLLMPIADNQIKPLQLMSQQGYFQLFYNMAQLTQLLASYRQQRLPVVQVPVLFGAPFVSELMLAQTVTLADVRPWDIRRNFHWLQNSELRRQFVMAQAPERAGHCRYWRNLLNSNAQYVFSILHEGKHVGSVGVKHINPARGEAEIWIYLGQTQQQQQGVGSKALLLLEAFVRDSLLLQHIVLHVWQGNTAALGFYQKHRYQLSEVNLPAEFVGKNVVQMRKAL